MQNLIFHSIPGEKASKLFALLKDKCNGQAFVTNSEVCLEAPIANDLKAEEQESLIVAFPDNIESVSKEELSKQVLTTSFEWLQRFVQTRMKKRFGQVLFLINANANGLLYSENINKEQVFLEAGLVGLMKTVSKEYSKRGILSNAIYIDWNHTELDEVSDLVSKLFVENKSLKGQVFALDGGKWL
ncbi:MAG TPA: hypothetical protein V6C96_00610 [Vampirovibrionales bacterium]